MNFSTSHFKPYSSLFLLLINCKLNWLSNDLHPFLLLLVFRLSRASASNTSKSDFFTDITLFWVPLSFVTTGCTKRNKPKVYMTVFHKQYIIIPVVNVYPQNVMTKKALVNNIRSIAKWNLNKNMYLTLHKLFLKYTLWCLVTNKTFKAFLKHFLPNDFNTSKIFHKTILCPNHHIEKFYRT